MGYFLQRKDGLPKGKAQYLIDHHGAVVASGSNGEAPEFVSPKTGFVLVIVLDNGAFEAAGVLYSQTEHARVTFKSPEDGRPRTYLLMECDVVASMSTEKEARDFANYR